jgi:hypothetical protein
LETSQIYEASYYNWNLWFALTFALTWDLDMKKLQTLYCFTDDSLSVTYIFNFIVIFIFHSCLRQFLALEHIFILNIRVSIQDWRNISWKQISYSYRSFFKKCFLILYLINRNSFVHMHVHLSPQLPVVRSQKAFMVKYPFLDQFFPNFV